MSSEDDDYVLGLRTTAEHWKLRHAYFMMPTQTNKGSPYLRYLRVPGERVLMLYQEIWLDGI
ncbi:hypothetical protein ACRRTK_004258 [Alexandromys fortis]